MLPNKQISKEFGNGEISMKKRLGVFCMALGMSGLAHAQSSVSLYGIIDAGFNAITNVGGGHQYAMTSGVSNGSRWGLLGSEDLGSGMKAVFRLENGFDVTNGTLSQGGRLFGRQAYTGLSSPYGIFTFGRQYDSLVDSVGGLVVSTQWAGNVGSHPGDLDNLNNTNRINNAVKYTSPTFGGVVLSDLYSFGGVAGDTSRSQIWSTGAKYAAGPLTIGAGYLNARNPNLSFFGSGTSSTPVAATASVSSPIYGGFLSAHTYQAIGTGVQYVIGNATIGAVYTNTKFINLGDITSGPNPSRFSGTATFNNAEVSFSYFVTPAIQLGAEYAYTESGGVGGNDGAKYHQGELAAHYFLSKRTDIYILGVYQHASGTDSMNRPAVAAINTLSPSSSNAQTLIRIGIRTKF